VIVNPIRGGCTPVDLTFKLTTTYSRTQAIQGAWKFLGFRASLGLRHPR
jgi:hypothetical protein